MTGDEIRAALDAAGVQYPKRAKVAELAELLATIDTGDDTDDDVAVNVPDQTARKVAVLDARISKLQARRDAIVSGRRRRG